MSNLQIVTTNEGRAIEYESEQFPLPALPFNVTVHAYQTPAGLWAGAQAPGDPRPVYAGSGGVKLGTIEMEADPEAVQNKWRDSAVVTMRQAALALFQAGHLENVQPAIDALPEPDRSLANIEWQRSGNVERNQPFVLLLGAAIGLSDTQTDDLFILAATL